MTIARLHPGMSTGPVALALGGLAAATLIAASLTGSGLTSDPWDVPALADAPPSSTGPVVITTSPEAEVTRRTAANDLTRPISTLTGAPEEPERRTAASRVVTTLTTHERTIPVSQEETLIEYARQTLRELVDQGTTGLLHDPARRPAQGTGRGGGPNEVDRSMQEEHQAVVPLPEEVGTPAIADLPMAVGEPRGADAPPAVEVIEAVQPELSTAAGSSSPLE